MQNLCCQIHPYLKCICGKGLCKRCLLRANRRVRFKWTTYYCSEECRNKVRGPIVQ